MHTTPIHLFTPGFAVEDIDDLTSRLKRTRFPNAETVEDWSQGIPLSYQQELIDYWIHEYDHQRVPARLNVFSNFQTEIDELDIHFIHHRSRHTSATPLLITHGWPGSVLEYLDVIEALTNPTEHGGSASDAFHVVLPALPDLGSPKNREGPE
jgi:hypothetical protein